jgi:ABC-2 type transport system ATP-binding protein
MPELSLIPARKPVIRLTGLRKYFRNGFFHKRILAVDGLQLEIERGEVFGLLGPNGAGKTTTLNMILGLITPTEGEGLVMGKKMGDWKARQRIGYLPESACYPKHFSAREVLLLSARLFSLNKREAEKRAAELLEQTGLHECADQRVSSFSKGMLQRLGLAQALVNDPWLLVLDEPLSGLDPIGRKQTKDLILALKDRGKTVVLSSHILPDVEMVCDRVGIIHRGRLVRCDTIDGLCAGHQESVELVVQTSNDSLVNSLEALAGSVRKTGEQYIAQLDSQERIERALGAVFKQDGRIISLSRKRQSLEKVFFEEMQQQDTTQRQAYACHGGAG